MRSRIPIVLVAVLVALVSSQSPGLSLAQTGQTLSHTGHRATTVPASFTFSLAPASPAMSACLAGVQATATLIPGGQNDTLTIHATHLPQFTAFSLFATQLPRAPYGLSTLLSALHSDDTGIADVTVQAALLNGLILPLGVDPAAPAKVQPGHLVLFFADPHDADRCFGGAAPATSFDAGLHVGPAVLATLAFPDALGPLQRHVIAPPGLGVSTPGGGRRLALSAVMFTTTCSDDSGWSAIRFVDFRLSLHGTPVLITRLDRPAKRMYIFDQKTGAWLGGATPGGATVLRTAFAALQVQASTVIGTAGSSGKVLWSVVFSNQAAGNTFDQSVRVTDFRFQTQGWNASGTWTVE